MYLCNEFQPTLTHRRMFPPRSASKGRTRSQDMFEGPLKTYKQFLETQDDNITPHEAEKKYDEYKVIS